MFDELPEEIKSLLGDDGVMDDQLNAISQVISRKVHEAVSFRKQSGLESVWMKAGEAYVGIDDVNREEFSGAKWIKPLSADSPLRRNTKDGGEQQSTIYPPLTSRYVDAAAAKCAEIVLPIDEKAFSFKASPVPELITAKNDESHVIDDDGTPLMKPDEQQSSVPIKVKDFAMEHLELAQEKAKKAETRIYDWMIESQYSAEMRKVIFDGAKLGVGILKGPFPEVRKKKSIRKTDTGIALEIIEYTAPACKAVSPWDCFPDPACGENIKNGEFFIERSMLSAKQVKALKKEQGYISSKIDEVLKDGPNKANNGNSGLKTENKHQYEVWYFYGTLNKDDAQAMNDAGGGQESFEKDAYMIVTLINDTAIRAIVNPLDSGNFPYHTFQWRRREGSWAGVGVAEQIDPAQRMFTAATRNLLMNAGKSAGAQIVLDKGAITPADGSYTLTRDKIWYKNPDSTVNDVRSAFATFQIPNVGPQMMSIIEYSMKLAEESTNIPLVSQGQTGPTTPETFGATALQNTNANQLLRSVGSAIDDGITVPLVQDYYEWLLLDPDVPDDEKGDWNINAQGTANFVERAIQDTTIAQMFPLVTNPAFGVDPKKLFSEYAKSKKLNPNNFQYSEEEQAQLEEKQKSQAPLVLPAVEAAKIRAESAKEIEAIRSQQNVQKMQLDTDRDTQYTQALALRAQNDHDATMAELAMRERLAMLDYANKKDITLEQVKAKLADTAMRLNVQSDLTAAGIEADLHKHRSGLSANQVITPAAEPLGKAPNGEAFIK